MMVEPTSKVEVVIAQLRELIRSRAAADGRLPSEPDLAQTLGTSRATVRQALTQLAAGGLVVRRHGSGTYVNSRVMNIGTRLEEVWDFAEMIHLAGYEPAIQHCSVEMIRSTPTIAERLALSDNADVLSTSNIFLADGVPVIYCLDILPAELVCSEYRTEELHGPIYRFLQERCSQRVEYNITEIRAVAADATLAATLQCEPGAPLHYFEETAYNNAGEPVLYSEEYYRPEFFRFKILRQMTTSST